jgi:hypothetical protein
LTTLETAIEHKIGNLKSFVGWWRENVRRKGGERWIDSADRGYQVSDAETITGIKHQQVSRWAKALKDEESYRAQLFGKEYQFVMGGMAHEKRGN